MRSSVIAFLLCASTAAAMGQCVSPAAMTATANKAAAATAAAAAAATTPAMIMVTPARPAGPGRAGPELITAAGAVTHDGPPVMQATPRAKHDPDERPRRSGPAMLLAALALMSGIALRRYSARNQ
jgi:hypothetical protein